MAGRPSAVILRSMSFTLGNGKLPLAFCETVIPDHRVKVGSFFARYPTSLGSSGSCSHTSRGSGGLSVDEALGTGLHAPPRMPNLVGPLSTKLGACP